MKNFIHNIPVKLKLLGLGSMVCLLFSGMLMLCEQRIQKGLYDQQMTVRWSKESDVSQISVFYAEGAVEDVNFFRGIEQSVEKALTQASVINEKENARLWIDAKSRTGKVTLRSDRANVEVNAVGISGEFFQFHPQKLVRGALLREDSMMRDGIVIDTQTAWQLFGSSDVEGMQVMIGQVPHFITGVIERPKGRLEEAAGLDKSICYLFLESLESYGTAEGGYTFEIVMPNPIKNFAYSAMQEAVGTQDDNFVLVENSARYKILPLLKVIQNFGIRSMSRRGIVYPYWENQARGYEDIFALTLLVKMILWILPCIFVISFLIYLWKRKTWTLKSVIHWGQEKLYEMQSQRAQKKKEEQV